MRRTGTDYIVFPPIGTLMSLLIILCLCGCASERPQIITTVLDISQPQPVFPPKQAMESGDYEGFLTENEKALEQCDESEECATAIFNLGFLHAYSKSPYYNRVKALWYFKILIRDYPNCSWTHMSLAWVDLIEKKVVLVKDRGRLNRLESELKAKEDAINDLRDQMKPKDDAIDKLRGQMKRSLDIDVELNRKERELIY